MEPSRQTWPSYGPPYPLGRWSCCYCCCYSYCYSYCYFYCYRQPRRVLKSASPRPLRTARDLGPVDDMPTRETFRVLQHAPGVPGPSAGARNGYQYRGRLPTPQHSYFDSVSPQ